MMRTIPAFLLLILAAGSIVARAAAETDAVAGALPPGPHRVGFRLFEEQDASRAIRVTGAVPETRPRPVRVYVWYPARPADGARPMTFGGYASLADGDVWPDAFLPGARTRMLYSRRPLARSLGTERYTRLLAQPVMAVENAPPAAGAFPLIVVGQGLYYESPVAHAALCEHLAGLGFVVATAPLVGTHSPLVSLDVIDLETQVRDLEFVIARARELPATDPERLGLLGYDMGGMACVVLAMRDPDVDAFASIDAGILHGHPSGIPESAPHHDPDLLRVPWLHATQRRFGAGPPDFEGASLFDAAVAAERYLVLVDGMGHADFNSYALVDERDPMMGYWAPRRGGERERYEAVVRYLGAFFRGYLADAPQGRALLAQDPDEVAPGFGITVEHRSAVAPPPAYPDMLNALLTGEPERAVKIARSLRERNPDHALLEEQVLVRLGYHLLHSWKLSAESIAVLELNLEWNPQSVQARYCLGDAYMLSGNADKAMHHMGKLLEMDPEHARAKRILEWLKTDPDLPD